MWFVLLMNIVLQVPATRISHDISSTEFTSTSPSSTELELQWPWQKPNGITNIPENSYYSLELTSGDNKTQQYNSKIQNSSDYIAEAYTTPQSSEESIDSVIDTILQSSREGRHLKGYDALYEDPEVKDILEVGNDRSARIYIRNKLCSLGLMNCENLAEKRVYDSIYGDNIHPQEIIHAQPVTIKSIGRPLLAIPVRRVIGYESSKPASLSSSSTSGQHDSLIYTGSYIHTGHHSRPHSPLSKQFITFNGPHPDHKKLGITSNTKPIHEDLGFNEKYDFIPQNKHEFIEKKPMIAQPSPSVQHVHHHYHHASDNEKPIPLIVETPKISTPIISSIPVTGNRFHTVGTNNYGHGSSGPYGNHYGGYGEYKKTFKLKSPSVEYNLGRIVASSGGYADRFSSYEQLKSDSFPNRKENGKGSHSTFSGNDFESNSHGLGYFGSKNFGSINSDDRLPSSFYEDCICIPYEQCAAINKVGRKDDLFLAIDPRNIEKSIDAESEHEVATDGNGTMNIIHIFRDVDQVERTQHSVEVKNSSHMQIEIDNNDNSTNNSKNKKREATTNQSKNENFEDAQSRQFGRPTICSPRYVCCRKSEIHPDHNQPKNKQCGVRNSQGVNGRIRTPSYVDGDSEFGEYPWQVAILRKDPTESVYVCGGTLISLRHILTAAHCVKTYAKHDLRARLGEWDVNHDVEFYPYIERDIINVNVHPEFYAGTLYNDIAILKLDHDIDFEKNPHIIPACLPSKYDDWSGSRCWTTGWGKDAFGEFGKYQNILKEVDVSVVTNTVCQNQMRLTRLGPSFNLHPGFICAGGEKGKDACKGDGGGPMVCEHNGVWHAVGVVSWGIGCGQSGVPGVYSRISYYLDWIQQIIQKN